MEYESNILKRLIDTYGVVGNPRYISEIIKEFIIQGKERYPELFTYQADWLAHIDEFGLNPSYTVSYTGQSIYAPNTLERPVKSAILKGRTLVNLVGEDKKRNTIANGGDIRNLTTFSASKEYTFYFKVEQINDNGLIRLQYLNGSTFISGENKNIVIGVNTITFTTPANTTDVRIQNSNGGIDLIIDDFMILEGDYTNADISYFDGMQSVKMPVLTTVGKNLFDFNDLELGNLNNIGEPTTSSTVRRNKNFINVSHNDKFTLSMPGYVKSDGWRYVTIYCYDGNKKYLGYIALGDNFNVYQNRTLLDNTKLIKICIGQPVENITDVFDVQLEKGTVATTYEPFKSNILTVNEDVTLRGIGDVRDELNCLTGEVTERIGEVVLDGSEDWQLQTNATDTRYTIYRLSIPDIDTSVNNSIVKCICDKAKASSWVDIYNTQMDKTFAILNNQQLRVQFNGSVEDLKSWLASDKPTVQYLKIESIKTVDLTILDQNAQNVKQLMSFNGGTHFNTGSLEGSLLPSISVTVETDLEETLKVCSLEGNTM